jgi:ferredoxin
MVAEADSAILPQSWGNKKCLTPAYCPSVEWKSVCQISLDIEKCEVCGDCVDTCLTEVLVLAESDGREVAEVVDADQCIGCESCVAVCPEEAITITEV